MKKIALYLRLSYSDSDIGTNDKDESNSIENQRELLHNYLEKKTDLDGEIEEYTDDGYSGTNFNRPSFLRMLEDAKKGQLKVIIVKDLSRLGRDYIGVGDYLERIFPSLGVRFIAVNSNYDSDNYIGKTMDLDMSITNLINSMYSIDISKKISSALESRWKQGINTTGRPPFGYEKNKETKEWIIDKKAAKIVKLIFKLACEGKNTKAIALELNKRKLPTPLIYYTEKYGGRPEFLGNAKTQEPLWESDLVLKILRKPEYTGVGVHGRYKRLKIGARPMKLTPKQDWICVENDHIPIVSKDEYDLAQMVVKRIKTPYVRHSVNEPFVGKVVCGNCGLNMIYTTPRYPKLYCAHGAMVGNESKCTKERIDPLKIEGLVRFGIKHRIDLLTELGNDIKEIQKQNYAQIDLQVKTIDERMTYLSEEKIRQYESFACGHLRKDEFLIQKQEILKEEICLRQKKETIISEKDEKNELIFEVNRLINKTEPLLKKNKLSFELVDAFVEKIVVYDSSKIVIFFKFDDLIEKLTALDTSEK